jgi:alpha-1,2-mannosyltransferase
MLLEILALLLLVVVAFVLVCRFVLLARTPAPLIDGKKPIVIGFFHPYCNSGGGGERVLWCALRALGELHKKTPLSIVVYTGDTDQKPEAILARAMDRFGVELSSDLPVRFEYLKQRDLLEASMYPRFTMIGQSIGSMVLTWEALRKCSPDIWMDTTGFAFSFPLAKYLAGCKIGAYVHYPTISMDMLGVVAEKRPTYNNDSAVSNSALKSTIKLYYYHLFAYLYTWVGRCCDVVMVNSHWTQNHILQLWQQPDKTSVVFPPCDTLTLQQQPLSGRKRVALSVGQFRPEKDHSLQLRAFKLLVTGQADDGEGGTVSTKEVKDVRLALVGSCRGEGDEGRVAALREEAKALGISDRVDFQLNVSWEKLQQVHPLLAAARCCSLLLTTAQYCYMHSPLRSTNHSAIPPSPSPWARPPVVCTLCGTSTSAWVWWRCRQLAWSPLLTTPAGERSARSTLTHAFLPCRTCCSFVLPSSPY